MNTSSIHFRLPAWYAGLLTLVYVLFAALLMQRVESFLEQNVLDTQARRARQIAATLVAPLARAAPATLVAQVRALYSPELSDRFIRITAADGTVLYRSGEPSDHSFVPTDVPSAPRAVARELRRRQQLPDGRALLIAAVRAGEEPAYIVEVGVSTASIAALQRQILWLTAMGLPIMVVLAVSGGYVLVKRALAPVERMAGKAELITHHNLAQRLPVARTGDELERLAISLNHMISRLDDAFQQSKRFAADASHELRTPLTVLRTELESLARSPQPGPDPYERLGSLLQPVERLSKTVERLFALSRLDAGEAQTEWIPIDLGELVATTVDQMLLLAADKGIKVTCDAQERVVVTGDRSRLKQIVVNLLDNAIKYTPAAGAVHLRVTLSDGQPVLSVEDSGIGIPAEALPHVFERFYRVDITRSTETGGAGLGLAIVKTICDAHGAVVRVASALGRGSSFQVTFPR
ncbi:MAG TPA: ATP-binding protein [Steroidobacteraceae bacterium]